VQNVADRGTPRPTAPHNRKDTKMKLFWKLALIALFLAFAMLVYRRLATGGPSDFLGGAAGPLSYGDVFWPSGMPEK
jgi:hypothetical protein